MLKNVFFILSFWVATWPAMAANVIHVSSEEAAILEVFLRTLFEKHEAGYVIFHQKPISIVGFCAVESFWPLSQFHRDSTAFKHGIQTWKNLVNDINQSQFYIHAYDQEDPLMPIYRHILIINIPLFHRVVNENLALFQRALDPTLTSESLLKAITDKDGSFHGLLQNNKLLIGILLGFGCQNSLYASRYEEIQEALSFPILPFQYPQAYERQNKTEFVPVKPSIGFKSVQDEMEFLYLKLEMSTKNLNENPPFGFGWIKESEQNIAFITELEKTQEQIRGFLQRPTFLQDTIEMFSGQKVLLEQKKMPHSTVEKGNQEEILALGIWRALGERTFFDYFLNGLQGTVQTSIKDEIGRSQYSLEEMLVAQENILEADRMLQVIKANPQYHVAIPQAAYYKIIAEGVPKGAPIGDYATLTYAIFSPQGECLQAETRVLIDLKKTIAGFRAGVHNMRIGETREIFIHPSAAYGYDRSNEGCYFKAIVTYVAQSDLSSAASHSKIEAELFDLSAFRKANKETSAAHHPSLMWLGGQNLRFLLQKYPKIDLNKIVASIKKYRNQKYRPIMGPLEEISINQIFWKAYFSSPESCDLCDSVSQKPL